MQAELGMLLPGAPKEPWRPAGKILCLHCRGLQWGPGGRFGSAEHQNKPTKNSENNSSRFSCPAGEWHSSVPWWLCLPVPAPGRAGGTAKATLLGTPAVLQLARDEGH